MQRTLARLILFVFGIGKVCIYVFCFFWIPDLYLWAKRATGQNTWPDTYMAGDFFPKRNTQASKE